MSEAATPATPVRVRALLVDPASMTVSWMNEAAASGAAELGGAPVESGASLEDALPAARMLDLGDIVRRVADDGETAHLSADLVSTAKGSMALAVSVDRLPDGLVLVLAENTWRSESKTAKAAGSSGRRRR